jgi:hypothetical protein
MSGSSDHRLTMRRFVDYAPAPEGESSTKGSIDLRVES